MSEEQKSITQAQLAAALQLQDAGSIMSVSAKQFAESSFRSLQGFASLNQTVQHVSEALSDLSLQIKDIGVNMAKAFDPQLHINKMKLATSGADLADRLQQMKEDMPRHLMGIAIGKAPGVKAQLPAGQQGLIDAMKNQLASMSKIKTMSKDTGKSAMANPIIEGFTQGFGDLIAGLNIDSIFHPVKTALGKGADKLFDFKSTGKERLQGIGEMIKSPLKGTLAQTMLSPLKRTGSVFGEGAKQTFAPGNSFKDRLGGIGKMATSPLQGLMGGTLGKGIMGGLGAGLSSLGPQMLALSIVMKPIGALLGGILEPLDMITDIFGAVGEILGILLLPIVMEISKILLPLMPTLMAAVQSLLPLIQIMIWPLTALGMMMQIIAPLLTTGFNLIGYLTNAIGAFFNNIKEFFQGIVDTISNVFGNWADKASGWVDNAKEEVGSWF